MIMLNLNATRNRTTSTYHTFSMTDPMTRNSNTVNINSAINDNATVNGDIMWVILGEQQVT
eukprot:2919296-Pyramimonas_sp.AAC.1